MRDCGAEPGQDLKGKLALGAIPAPMPTGSVLVAWPARQDFSARSDWISVTRNAKKGGLMKNPHLLFVALLTTGTFVWPNEMHAQSSDRASVSPSPNAFKKCPPVRPSRHETYRLPSGGSPP